MLTQDLKSIKFDLVKFTPQSSFTVGDNSATAEIDSVDNSIMVPNFKTDYFIRNFTVGVSTLEYI